MTDVVMPQMGESIVEGTLTKWLKKPGDRVERDEPLFEISTDKVDAEIPSPAAGRLVEIRVKEGETVPVDTVVAVIAQPDEAVAVSAAEGASSGAEISAAAPPPAQASSLAGDAGRAAGGAVAALSGEALRDHLRRTK
ncbi:MAG: hypothetical protein K6T61_11910, partial [Bryobacteraceae bacterium]|nr:hypothetical protein [Bryobacteraceae bacterium]